MESIYASQWYCLGFMSATWQGYDVETKNALKAHIHCRLFFFAPGMITANQRDPLLLHLQRNSQSIGKQQSYCHRAQRLPEHLGALRVKSFEYPVKYRNVFQITWRAESRDQEAKITRPLTAESIPLNHGNVFLQSTSVLNICRV